MRRLCETAKALSLPFEINFLGVRRGRRYPNPLFWEIAGEIGCKVVFGFDAHLPEHAYDGESLEKVLEIVRKNRLEVIDIPDIKDPEKAL
jgi:histidinol-phosphatase (PHP family)